METKSEIRMSMGKGLSTCIWLHILVIATAMGSTHAFLLDDQCMAPLPCHCTAHRINCEVQHLSYIPTFSPTTTHVENLTILLPGNDLTVLPANAFRNINTTGATWISIWFQSNKLYKMDKDAFAGIENTVIELWLQDNRFTGIPVALTTLTRLQRLYMQANPFTTIDPLATALMSPSLEEFTFDGKTLVSWPYGLNNLHHLTHLTIDGMPYQHVPLDAFSGFGETLTELKIFGTYTGSIPSSVCFLRNLKVLQVNQLHYRSQQELLQLHEKCREFLSNVASYINV